MCSLFLDFTCAYVYIYRFFELGEGQFFVFNSNLDGEGQFFVFAVLVTAGRLGLAAVDVGGGPSWPKPGR